MGFPFLLMMRPGKRQEAENSSTEKTIILENGMKQNVFSLFLFSAFGSFLGVYDRFPAPLSLDTEKHKARFLLDYNLHLRNYEN